MPGHRSSHTQPTPKGGGIGIVAALVAGLLWARAEPVLVAAVAGLALVSFLDDLFDWPFTTKLAGQFVAAAALVESGVRCDRVECLGWHFDLGLLAAPLSWAWLMFVTNAVNFMDGLDGLVAGCALIACAAYWHVPATLPLAAGLCGFLTFNWPRARIFMGDVGSQPLGLALATLPLWPRGIVELPAVLPLAPLLLDALATMARRLLARERLTEAHRGHFYQVARRAGLAAPVVSVAYWALTGLGTAAAIGAAWGEMKLAWLFGAALAVAAVAWGGFVVLRSRRAGITHW